LETTSYFAFEPEENLLKSFDIGDNSSLRELGLAGNKLRAFDVAATAA
jgi:hypothetical protein